jgi:uncharacterized repeat protein (TIGR01451 family)
MFAACRFKHESIARGALGGPRRSRAVRAMLLGALMVASMAVAASSAMAAPGVPAPPSTVFLEDFENTGTAAVLLTGYQGAPPAQNETYTAAPGWLRDCNGWVVTGASPQPANTLNCDLYWGSLQGLARSLGTFQGLADPNTNHAVAAYTASCGDPASPQFGTTSVCGGANQVQWETQSPITVPANRFYTFSVDAAYTSCQAAHPLFDFSIVAGATEIPTSPTPIDGCINGNGAYSFTSNGSIFLTNTSIGLRMRNRQGSVAGNDGAFDNVRLLDVTPTLDKSFSPASLNVGQSSRLTFTVTNTTELAAKNGWSFTDNLPSGLKVASPAGASTTCSGGSVSAAAGGTSVSMSGNLNAGQASCTVSVDVTSPAAGTFTNCASNVSLVGLNPPACSSVTFLQADVEIEKTTAVTVVPGTEATYLLKVTNHGPSTATNVKASDALPSALSFVSASPGCSEANKTVTCSIASLASGASQTFTVKAKVASSADSCSTLRNKATVTNDVVDPDISNNSSSVCDFERRSDLSITKTPSAARVSFGGQVMYTLVVKNNGPSDNSNVTVTDPMAAGLSLVSAKPSQGSCATTGGQVSCDLGTLKADGSAQVLVTAQTTTSGCITNTSKVTGDAKDPTAANNEAAAKVCADAPPPPNFDLVVTKTAANKSVYVGQALRYTLTVANEGPEAAPNAKVTDTLNAPASVVSVKATQGSCTKSIPMTCQLGTIPAGGKVTINVTVKLRDNGCKQRNAASATGAGNDTNPANNLARVDVCAKPVPLRLTKVADSSSVRARGLVGYTIRVSNPTVGEAQDVQVCDRLPSGLVYVSSKAKAKFTKGQYCWSIDTLAAHQSRSFRITVRALGSASGDRVNRATASAKGATTRHAKDPVRVLGARASGGGVTG